MAQLLAPTLPRMAGPVPAEVAADLKAAFGGAAVICIHADDANSPLGPSDRSGHCDDCCPLCQFHSGVHALILPTLAGLPGRRIAESEKLGLALPTVSRKPSRTAFAQPRAPPLEA